MRRDKRCCVGRDNKVLAVEAFIQRYENQKLLEQLNQAYGDEPQSEEEDGTGMRRHHRDVVVGEW